MKNAIFCAILAVGLLSACSDNATKVPETTTTTEPDALSADSSRLVSADSMKAAMEKRAKDSADAAHGHSH